MGALDLHDGRKIAGRFQTWRHHCATDAREVLRAKFPGWTWIDPEGRSTHGRWDVVKIDVQTDKTDEEIDWARFRGEARFRTSEYRRHGSATPTPGATLTGGSAHIEVMGVTRAERTILLDLRACRIFETDLADPLTVGILLIHPGREIAVLPSQQVEETAGNAPARYRNRMGRIIWQSRQRFEFSLPEEAARDVIEDFELQLWTPVQVGRAVAEIEVRPPTQRETDQ